MPDHDTYQGGQFSTLFSPIPWTFFHAVLQYCLDVCAFSKSVAEDYSKTIDIGLKSIVRAQGQYQKDSDEVERFIGLLRACFNSGECHVVDYLTKGPPTFNPYTWGWRKLAEKEG